MSNTVNIRKATKRDLKDISGIFKRESSKKPYFQKWTDRTALERIIEFSKTDDIFVVMANDKLVGFIVSHIGIEEKGKGAFVKEIWLKQEYQGKGIGKSLMRFIEHKYKNKGVKSIFLMSNKKSNAFGFYKKLKYKEDNDFILMGKKLSR